MDIKRNFQIDFCLPALQGLTPQQAERVGIALDTAIAFGVLEYTDGNPSLLDTRVIAKKYWDNVRRLGGRSALECAAAQPREDS